MTFCQLPEHITGRTLTYDWSVNSFIVDVYENYLSSSNRFSGQSRTEKKLMDNHYKTILDKSELRTLPAECFLTTYETVMLTLTLSAVALFRATSPKQMVIHSFTNSSSVMLKMKGDNKIFWRT